MVVRDRSASTQAVAGLHYSLIDVGIVEEAADHVDRGELRFEAAARAGPTGRIVVVRVNSKLVTPDHL